MSSLNGGMIKMVFLVAILLVYFASTALSYPAKPLNERPQDLTWEAWLLVDENQNQHRHAVFNPDGTLRRRITPKSVFIAPTFSPESLPACADGYSSDPMGRCIKIIKLDEEAHYDFIIKNLEDKFGSFDYEDEENNEEAAQAPQGPLQLNIPLGFDKDKTGDDYSEEETDIAIVVTPTKPIFEMQQYGFNKRDSLLDQEKQEMLLKKLAVPRMTTTTSTEDTPSTIENTPSTVENTGSTTENDVSTMETAVPTTENALSTTQYPQTTTTENAVSTTKDTSPKTVKVPVLPEIVTRFSDVEKPSSVVPLETTTLLSKVLQTVQTMETIIVEDESTTTTESILLKTTTTPEEASTTDRETEKTSTPVTYPTPFATEYPITTQSPKPFEVQRDAQVDITSTSSRYEPSTSSPKPEVTTRTFVRFPDQENSDQRIQNTYVRFPSSGYAYHTQIPPSSSARETENFEVPGFFTRKRNENPVVFRDITTFRDTTTPSSDTNVDYSDGDHVATKAVRWVFNRRNRDKNSSVFMLPSKWDTSTFQKPVVLRFSRKHAFMDEIKSPSYYRSIPSDDFAYLFKFKQKRLKR